MKKDYLDKVYKKFDDEKQDIFKISFSMLLIEKTKANVSEAKFKNVYGLSRSEVNIIMNLYWFENIQSPTKLYERMIFSSGGITKILKKLENLELVSRIKDRTDKRSTLVKLEKKGKYVAEKLNKDMLEFNSKILEVLSNEEKKVLESILKKVIYSMATK